MRLATAAATTAVLLAGTAQAAQRSVNGTAGAIVWAAKQPSAALKSNDPRQTQSAPSRPENSVRDGLSSPTPVSGDSAAVAAIDDLFCGPTRDSKQCAQQHMNWPAPTTAPEVAGAAGAKHLASPGKFMTFTVTDPQTGKERKIPIELMYPNEIPASPSPSPTGKEASEKGTKKNTDRTKKTSDEKSKTQKKNRDEDKKKKKDDKIDKKKKTKNGEKKDAKSDKKLPKPKKKDPMRVRVLKEIVEKFAKFWEKLWGLKRRTKSKKKAEGSQALFVTPDMVAQDEDLAALIETVAGALGVASPNIPEKNSAQESKGKVKGKDEDAKIGSAFRWFDNLPTTQNKKKAPSEPQLSIKDRAIFQKHQHRCDFRASHATPTETDEQCLAKLKAKLADNRRAVENGSMAEADVDKDLPSTDKGCDGIVAYQQRISKKTGGGDDSSEATTTPMVERRNVRHGHQNGSLARARGRPDVLAARRAASRFQANHAHNKDKLAVQPRDVDSVEEGVAPLGNIYQPEEEQAVEPKLSRRWSKKPKFRFGSNEDHYQEQGGQYGCEDGRCHDTVRVRDEEARPRWWLNNKLRGEVFDNDDDDDDDDDHKLQSLSSGGACTAKSILGLLIAVALALLL